MESDTEGASGEDSRFPALFGDLIGGGGQPDAKQRLKLGGKPDAKQSKKDDGMPVALPNPLDTFTPRALETANLSHVPTFGELGADLSLSANPEAEPSAAESDGLAAGLQANQIAWTPAEQTGFSNPAMQAMQAMQTEAADVATAQPEVAGIGTAQPEAADETQATGTAPGTDAPAENTPAENAPPDWTKLLDSAAAAARIVSPQRDGFHPATARQKVAGSSEAQVPELAALDPNPKVGVPVTPAVPEERVVQEAQPSPLPRLESDSLEQKRQTAATAASAEPVPDAPAQAAATSPDSMNPGEPSTVAFEAHLIPMTADATPWRAPTEDPAKTGAPDRPPLVAADSPGKPAAPAVAPSTAADHQQDNAASSGQDRKDNAPERVHKTDAPQPSGGEAPLTFGKSALAMPVAPPEAGRVSGQLSGQPASSSGSNALRPRETVELPSAPEPPPAPAAARDIRLEVNDGDRRVEVRLVERDGEVHVAVRTPDAHLAETLREDLPALSSRLTETGFRTETWHPGASGGTELHRQAEPANGASPQDSSGQPRQNGREQEPGGQQSARPKVPEEQLHRKEKGKDFEWFMSTLQ